LGEHEEAVALQKKVNEKTFYFNILLMKAENLNLI
jgi:hypothetical protein